MLNNKKFWFAVIGLLIITSAILHERFVSGQNSQSAFKTIEKEKTSIYEPSLPLTIALKTVAAENVRLKNNLVWTLGNKEQRGWYLYEPLIQRLIGTERDADSSEFALSLAYWQQQNAMQPTGMVGEETLNQMIKSWQELRIANKEVAQPEKLFTAPIADFYDPTREIALLKVERETYLAYKRMVAEAAKDPTLNLKSNNTGELAADEKRLKIISAFRSPEYQEKLRKASPNSSRTALALFSSHFTGRALDIYVGGEPVITKDANRAIQINTPVYKWLVKNAGRFGFYPYYYEPWHWEYAPENSKITTMQPR
ncbi:MAG: D-alanyl-D-alanine carboxypeptidase family protein [Pyrinomonadaceae bacterium]